MNFESDSDDDIENINADQNIWVQNRSQLGFDTPFQREAVLAHKNNPNLSPQTSKYQQNPQKHPQPVDAPHIVSSLHTPKVLPSISSNSSHTIGWGSENPFQAGSPPSIKSPIIASTSESSWAPNSSKHNGPTLWDHQYDGFNPAAGQPTDDAVIIDLLKPYNSDFNSTHFHSQSHLRDHFGQKNQPNDHLPPSFEVLYRGIGKGDPGVGSNQQQNSFEQHQHNLDPKLDSQCTSSIERDINHNSNMGIYFRDGDGDQKGVTKTKLSFASLLPNNQPQYGYDLPQPSEHPSIITPVQYLYQTISAKQLRGGDDAGSFNDLNNFGDNVNQSCHSFSPFPGLNTINTDYCRDYSKIENYDEWGIDIGLLETEIKKIIETHWVQIETQLQQHEFPNQGVDNQPNQHSHLFQAPIHSQVPHHNDFNRTQLNRTQLNQPSNFQTRFPHSYDEDSDLLGNMSEFLSSSLVNSSTSIGGFWDSSTDRKKEKNEPNFSTLDQNEVTLLDIHLSISLHSIVPTNTIVPAREGGEKEIMIEYSNVSSFCLWYSHNHPYRCSRLITIILSDMLSTNEHRLLLEKNYPKCLKMIQSKQILFTVSFPFLHIEHLISLYPPLSRVSSPLSFFRHPFGNYFDDFTNNGQINTGLFLSCLDPYRSLVSSSETIYQRFGQFFPQFFPTLFLQSYTISKTHKIPPSSSSSVDSDSHRLYDALNSYLLPGKVCTSAYTVHSSNSSSLSRTSTHLGSSIGSQKHPYCFTNYKNDQLIPFMNKYLATQHILFNDYYFTSILTTQRNNNINPATTTHMVTDEAINEQHQKPLVLSRQKLTIPTPSDIPIIRNINIGRMNLFSGYILSMSPYLFFTTSLNMYNNTHCDTQDPNHSDHALHIALQFITVFIAPPPPISLPSTSYPTPISKPTPPSTLNGALNHSIITCVRQFVSPHPEKLLQQISTATSPGFNIGAYITTYGFINFVSQYLTLSRQMSITTSASKASLIKSIPQRRSIFNTSKTSNIPSNSSSINQSDHIFLDFDVGTGAQIPNSIINTLTLSQIEAILNEYSIKPPPYGSQLRPGPGLVCNHGGLANFEPGFGHSGTLSGGLLCDVVRMEVIELGLIQHVVNIGDYLKKGDNKLEKSDHQQPPQNYPSNSTCIPKSISYPQNLFQLLTGYRDILSLNEFNKFDAGITSSLDPLTQNLPSEMLAPSDLMFLNPTQAHNFNDNKYLNYFIHKNLHNDIFLSFFKIISSFGGIPGHFKAKMFTLISLISKPLSRDILNLDVIPPTEPNGMQNDSNCYQTQSQPHNHALQIYTPFPNRPAPSSSSSQTPISKKVPTPLSTALSLIPTLSRTTPRTNGSIISQNSPVGGDLGSFYGNSSLVRHSPTPLNMLVYNMSHNPHISTLYHYIQTRIASIGSHPIHQYQSETSQMSGAVKQQALMNITTNLPLLPTDTRVKGLIDSAIQTGLNDLLKFVVNSTQRNETIFPNFSSFPLPQHDVTILNFLKLFSLYYWRTISNCESSEPSSNSHHGYTPSHSYQGLFPPAFHPSSNQPLPTKPISNQHIISYIDDLTPSIALPKINPDPNTQLSKPLPLTYIFDLVYVHTVPYIPTHNAEVSEVVDHILNPNDPIPSYFPVLDTFHDQRILSLPTIPNTLNLPLALPVMIPQKIPKNDQFDFDTTCLLGHNFDTNSWVYINQIQPSYQRRICFARSYTPYISPETRVFVALYSIATSQYYNVQKLNTNKAQYIEAFNSSSLEVTQTQSGIELVEFLLNLTAVIGKLLLQPIVTIECAYIAIMVYNESYASQMYLESPVTMLPRVQPNTAKKNLQKQRTIHDENNDMLAYGNGIGQNYNDSNSIHGDGVIGGTSNNPDSFDFSQYSFLPKTPLGFVQLPNDKLNIEKFIPLYQPKSIPKQGSTLFSTLKPDQIYNQSNRTLLTHYFAYFQSFIQVVNAFLEENCVGNDSPQQQPHPNSHNLLQLRSKFASMCPSNGPNSGFSIPPTQLHTSQMNDGFREIHELNYSPANTFSDHNASSLSRRHSDNTPSNAFSRSQYADYNSGYGDFDLTDARRNQSTRQTKAIERQNTHRYIPSFAPAASSRQRGYGSDQNDEYYGSNNIQYPQEDFQDNGRYRNRQYMNNGNPK